MADGGVGHTGGGLVHDAQLGAEHAGLASTVDGAQRELPEAPSGRQQWVVGHEIGLVGRLGSELGAAEVLVDLAAHRVEGRLEDGYVFGLLAEHDLTDDGLHVGGAQPDLDGKAIEELLKSRASTELVLTCCNDEKLTLIAVTAALHEQLHVHGLGVVVVDVLLHLVEHDEGERQLAAGRRLETQHIVHDVEHLVVGDVLRRRRELRPQQISHVLHRAAESGVGVEERLGDQRRHVEIVDLLVERTPLRLDGGTHGIEVAVLPGPDREASAGVLLGQTGALEQHRQERQADGVTLAGGERASGRPKAAHAPARGRQLGEVVGDVVGDGDEVAGTVAAGELHIAPQVLEDPDKVRLAAAVEAAHPGRRLLCLAEVGEEAVEDAFETSRVLPVAHEAAQLPSQHLPLLVGLGSHDLGDAVVRDLRVGRITVEELSVRDRHRPLPFGVIGIAR